MYGTAWRYVDCGAVTPFENVSHMPVLARQVAETGRPTVTTSVWGQTHLNVGWFDDVDATLDLDACARHGIAVIRRPMYGGGTAYYQAGCAVLWAFLLPKADDADLDAALARFQPVITDTLHDLGLGAVGFEGSSDLRWHGRKLGALAPQDVGACHSVGGFLNVRRPDVDLYLRVARVPDDKFKDKVVKDLREYVCAAEDVMGEPVEYEAFRHALLTALAAAGIELHHQPLTEKDRVGVAKRAARIADEAMVRRVSSDRFAAAAPPGTRVGFGNEKGRKLCRAGVAVDGEGRIAAAMVAGDMHVSPPDTLDRVADALVGADAHSKSDLRARIRAVFDGPDVHQAETSMGVTTDDLLAAVRKAVDETVRPAWA
ncbi:MAG: lipoate--protein ligase family protein [Acidimicrobiales bacterium]